MRASLLTCFCDTLNCAHGTVRLLRGSPRRAGRTGARTGHSAIAAELMGGRRRQKTPSRSAGALPAHRARDRRRRHLRRTAPARALAPHPRRLLAEPERAPGAGLRHREACSRGARLIPARGRPCAIPFRPAAAPPARSLISPALTPWGVPRAGRRAGLGASGRRGFLHSRRRFGALLELFDVER